MMQCMSNNATIYRCGLLVLDLRDSVLHLPALHQQARARDQGQVARGLQGIDVGQQQQEGRRQGQPVEATPHRLPVTAIGPDRTLPVACLLFIAHSYYVHDIFHLQ